MSAQTAYALNIAKAVAGLLYAQAPHDVISRSIETAAGAAFGLAVSRGTDADSQAVIGGTAFLGVTLRTLDLEGAANTGAISYAVTETAAIISNGYVWVVCPTGCVPGDAVNYVDSGAAAAGEQALNDAEWVTTAAAGGLAVLRLNSTKTTAGS
jgi:hypothetical protein